MNIEEIKAAVDAGKVVHWANTNYTVIKDSNGEYLIRYRGLSMENFIGLINRKGDKLNGEPDDFYIGEM